MMNLLIALVCTVDGAVVYQWVDVDGLTHYTNNPSTIPAGATVTPTSGQDINVISVDQPDTEPDAPAAAQPTDEEETEPDQLPPDAQLTPEEQAAQQQAIAEQQGQVTSVSEFEEPLAASGQWMDVDGYRVWQPSASVVGSDFVPYQTNGHWEWTTAGWVFVSDYDWGWAAFHYGRWWQSPSYGWLWYPGLAWGPAWVSWRVGGGYAGWAPLWPRHIRWHPRWCFVPTQHMGDVAFHRYALHGAGYGVAFHATARLPFRAYGPSVAGVQRWGGSVPMGSLNRSGFGHGPAGWSGGYRAPPSAGAFRPQPPVGYGGYRPAPPMAGGYRAPPPSAGGYRAPPPSVGGFRGPPSSGEFRAPPSSGGFRAPPPSVGGFRGGYSAPHSGSFGGSSGGGFHSAPSFGGPHSGGGGFHGGGSPGGGHFGGGGHGRR